MTRLLIRPGAIGDFIVSLPALESLTLNEARLKYESLAKLKALKHLKRLTMDSIDLSSSDVERLNKELQVILKSAEMKQRLLAEGSEPAPGTPQDYGANIHREEGKWAALGKKLGLKLE